VTASGAHQRAGNARKRGARAFRECTELEQSPAIAHQRGARNALFNQSLKKKLAAVHVLMRIGAGAIASRSEQSGAVTVLTYWSDQERKAVTFCIRSSD
jgi:hypothetical protein